GALAGGGLVDRLLRRVGRGVCCRRVTGVDVPAPLGDRLPRPLEQAGRLLRVLRDRGGRGGRVAGGEPVEDDACGGQAALDLPGADLHLPEHLRRAGLHVAQLGEVGRLLLQGGGDVVAQGE